MFKHMVGEMPSPANVVVGKCPVDKVCVGDVSGLGNASRKVSVGNLSSGKSVNQELTTWEFVQIPFVL